MHLYFLLFESFIKDFEAKPAHYFEYFGALPLLQALDSIFMYFEI